MLMLTASSRSSGRVDIYFWYVVEGALSCMGSIRGFISAACTAVIDEESSAAPYTRNDLWSFAARFTRFWDRFKVELHGRFSSRKVEEMREYAAHTSRLHLLLVDVLTPVPALIAITLVDCTPLVSPDEGTDRNYAFWILMIIAMTIVLAGLFNHFRCCLPGLPMSNW